MEKRRSDGLPPNFDDLPVSMKRVIEEQIYRRQLIHMFGYLPGDERLTSMDEAGREVHGVFSRRSKDAAGDAP